MNAPGDVPQPTGSCCSRRRRWLVGLLVVGLIGLSLGEAVLRIGPGLGDPPLYDRDPELEYVLKPSRRYRYRHHDYSVNSHRMRASEFPAVKPAGEFRVLVVGDSLLEGGGRIDQSELATERLAVLLQKSLARPVTVGNVSAASWGPPNQLAFLKRYGLFDADVVLLVSNSGDVDDVPGLEAIGAVWPESTPLLAIQEPLQRQLERRLPSLAVRLGWLTPAHPPAQAERAPVAAAALSEICTLVRSSGAAIGIVQYWNKSELAGSAEPGHDAIAATAARAGVRTWQTRDSFRSANSVESCFLPGDDVHPSPTGHALLAGVLEQAVLELTRSNPPQAR